jgi:NADPH:quinone reductase-like Zn-dependent oxidoreductase
MARRYRFLLIAFAVLVAGLSVFAFNLSHDAACSAVPPLRADAPRMNAILHRCYGAPALLGLEQAEKPGAADGRVLIRVHAAAVNPLDWHEMRGTPYILRMDTGFGAPKDPRLGVDFSGTVEAVGKGVTRYKPGDEVFGGAAGAFAEYVTVAENRALALKPSNVSFQQAAAVPIAALTALQALRDKGALKAGQKVLINGASGGVGTFAVQIARALGADVTGVCSAKNVAMVGALGAQHVIDYTREDFSQGSQRYDLILDAVGNHSRSDLRRVLSPEGRVVMIGGAEGGPWLGPLADVLQAIVASKFATQKFVFLLADLNPKDLATLGELMQSGKVTPVIDRRYPLSETPAAIAYLEQGHARGKVIIDVADGPPSN